MSQQVAANLQHAARHEAQLEQLQQALAEGLQAINQARTEQEAEAARCKARARLQALGRQFAPSS